MLSPVIGLKLFAAIAPNIHIPIHKITTNG